MTPSATCSVGRVDLKLYPVLLVRPQRNGPTVLDRDRLRPVPRRAPAPRWPRSHQRPSRRRASRVGSRQRLVGLRGVPDYQSRRPTRFREPGHLLIECRFTAVQCVAADGPWRSPAPACAASLGVGARPWSAVAGIEFASRTWPRTRTGARRLVVERRRAAGPSRQTICRDSFVTGRWERLDATGRKRVGVLPTLWGTAWDIRF